MFVTEINFRHIIIVVALLCPVLQVSSLSPMPQAMVNA